MKNIVVMGGSFNPPTIAHLKLIQTALDAMNAERGYVGGQIVTKMVKHNPCVSVTINQGSNSGGNSTGGSYTILSYTPTLNLDYANHRYEQIVFTCGTNFSDTVYLEDNSGKGNIASASLQYTEGNKAYYMVDSFGLGTQYIKFQLCWEKSPTYRVIKDSVSVRVNVTCSHNYDKGVVSKEATKTEAGSKTYTCLSCGHQKTETIPATANSLSGCEISLSSSGYTYTGSACRPSVTVRLGSRTLISGSDYTVSYSNNTNAGTAKVTVTGKGSYTGSASKNFTINKASQTLNVTVPSTTLKKGSTAQITASGTGTITYKSSDTAVASVSTTGLITAKSAGKTTITVTAAGNTNYNSSSKSVSITVTETAPSVPISMSFSDSSITLNKGSSRVITVTTFGGLPAKFTFFCKRSNSTVISTAWTGGWKNVNGKHSHDLAISGISEGKAFVTVYVKDSNAGNYVASKSIDITVKALSAASNEITGNSITLSQNSYTYSGKAKKPGVTVTVGGKKLKRTRIIRFPTMIT